MKEISLFKKWIWTMPEELITWTISTFLHCFNLLNCFPTKYQKSTLIVDPRSQLAKLSQSFSLPLFSQNWPNKLTKVGSVFHCQSLCRNHKKIFAWQCTHEHIGNVEIREVNKRISSSRYPSFKIHLAGLFHGSCHHLSCLPMSNLGCVKLCH